jgi:hypothetical protein
MAACVTRHGKWGLGLAKCKNPSGSAQTAPNVRIVLGGLRSHVTRITASDLHL